MVRKIKPFVFLSSFVLCCFSIFAASSGRVEEITVKNLNSWQENFDLDGKKAGKYNIMITAEDFGGNVAVAGPHNIFIDPNSDRPICGITSPYSDMRVAGNLNIVGTAIDDDGVSRIELILDEGLTDSKGNNIEKKVIANGKEFWSYYLDTNDLEEGPHTIKVIGYDINSEPVVSDPIIVQWQLDRQLPVTKVQDKEMGLLVSGNVHFYGQVTDGNGIESLEYSVDGGKLFDPIKLKKNKDKGMKEFSISVDTKKFDDGPSVLWFRAKDSAGSVGLYSFLYFIDNTKPDVKIVSPLSGDVLNGKITVAGYAKDKIGVKGLSWTFGEMSGVIDLIPGNPYWAVNLDTTDCKDKAKKFSITAIDKADNDVTVSQNIKLNQENDKPVVSLFEPEAGALITDVDSLYARGLVTDDDKVVSVSVQLNRTDKGNETVLQVEQENNGVYNFELLKPGELETGEYKLTVVATDINGIKSNPFVIDFSGKKELPSIANPIIYSGANSGKGGIDFVNGIEIHPESGSVITIPVSSPFGLKNVHYKVSWGKSDSVEKDIPIQKKNDYIISIPVEPNSAKGVMNLAVSATDNLDRVSNASYTYFVTNTSVIKSNENKIIFDDSRIDEKGVIISDESYVVSGYALGEKAASVELIPSTPFAKAELKGNQIRIITTDKEGISQPVTVKVTYESGRHAESRQLVFKNETKKPEITLSDMEDCHVINMAGEDSGDGDIVISGKASSILGIKDIGYRIIPINTEIRNYVINKITVGKTGSIKWASDFVAANENESVPDQVTSTGVVIPTINAELQNKDGDFTLTIQRDGLSLSGLYIVEIVAKSNGGMKSAKSVVVKNISDVPVLDTPEGGKAPKQPVAKAPVIVWLDGVDVYGVGVYQGNLDKTLEHFQRSEMSEGSNNLSMTVSAEGGVAVSSQFKAEKEYILKANFANVDGAEYLSGMPVVVNYGIAKTGPVLQVVIDSSNPVTSVTYEITGDNVPGGNVTTKGTVKLGKPSSDNPNRWIAEIPLINLPVRYTKINVTVKAGSAEKTISGTVAVVRPQEMTLENDLKVISSLPGTGTYYDDKNQSFVLNNGSKYLYYGNFAGPVHGEIISSEPGLSLEVIGGNLIAISATKEGYYKNVTVKITDNYGDVYESSPINFIADSSVPVVNLTSPTRLDWVKNIITIAGTATDPIGVSKIEYSVDKGNTWREIQIESGKIGVTFSKEIDISSLPDGLITIDIRATDNIGKTTYLYSANYKDTTAPKITVVQPLDLDIINGTNLIVFDVDDNVALKSADYFAPEQNKEKKSESISLNPLISTLIGTDTKPIDNNMSFEFTDYAGNKADIGSWKFSIDSNSDLPIAEIHVPDEMQVITRDFSISGVVYDDDGESSVFYKIDDGEYKQVAVNEVYKRNNPAAEYKLSSSYSISVPFDTMTDNEHVISVYAVDINGVKGPEATRTFRVSTEEPKGAVLLPTIDTAVKGTTTISGVASDNNGIEKVQVSLDNGCSYNDAVGTTEWSYTVDTRVIPGGTQVVFLKVFDKYGLEGLYSSLINIDNDAPELNLELPLDDSTSNGTLFFSGYTFDNVEVNELYVTIRSLDKKMEPRVEKLKIDSIIGQSLDVSDLEDGFYNVEVTSNDAANNVTNVSRNIHLKKEVAPAVVDILYPLSGEHKSGEFTIYGQSEAESAIQALKLYIDDKFAQETVITGSGFYKFDMNPETITEGTHKYRVDAILEDGTKVSSRDQTITYSPYGPWVTIDNFTYGDFAIDRPKIQGRAGYSVSDEDKALLKDKHTPRQIKEEIENRKIAKIEISFNNGKSFTEISKKGKWEYRIENQDLPAGYHFMFVKATMMNGEVAVNRTIIQIDNESPKIKLRAPSIGGRYNQTLSVSGLSNDDVKLENVTVALRKGDKSAYGVPSFIQGLYLDVKGGGASLFQVGAGLTFFDDVVKVQVGYGQLTREQFSLLKGKPTDFRIGGHIIDLKILANVADIPFNFFFGHDFDWLSATLAIGADFSWFSDSGRAEENAKGKGKFVSALVGQLEFPRVTLKKAKAFSTFSFYTECAVWVFPTDVSSTTSQKVPTIIPKVSFGLRTNIF